MRKRNTLVGPQLQQQGWRFSKFSWHRCLLLLIPICLGLCAGYPAIYGRQPLYFQDPVFAARAALQPPEQTDTLSGALRNAPLPEVEIL